MKHPSPKQEHKHFCVQINFLNYKTTIPLSGQHNNSPNAKPHENEVYKPQNYSKVSTFNTRMKCSHSQHANISIATNLAS